MSPEDDAKAFELVRVRGLSYVEAGKQLGGIPKSSVRNAVTREAVRRARVEVSGVAEAPPAPTEPGARVDAGFMARVLAAGPLPSDPPQAPRVVHADDADENDLTVDVETLLRRQLKRIETAIATATDGEAQKYSRVAAALASDLRKYEREKRADEGILTYTLADVAAVRADLKKKVADVQHRGLTCAECGRRMRKLEAQDGEADDGEDE